MTLPVTAAGQPHSIDLYIAEMRVAAVVRHAAELMCVVVVVVGGWVALPLWGGPAGVQLTWAVQGHCLNLEQ